MGYDGQIADAAMARICVSRQVIFLRIKEIYSEQMLTGGRY
jgi:hypothetical protein